MSFTFGYELERLGSEVEDFYIQRWGASRYDSLSQSS